MFLSKIQQQSRYHQSAEIYGGHASEPKMICPEAYNGRQARFTANMRREPNVKSALIQYIVFSGIVCIGAYIDATDIIHVPRNFHPRTCIYIHNRECPDCVQFPGSAIYD